MNIQLKKRIKELGIVAAGSIIGGVLMSVAYLLQGYFFNNSFIRIIASIIQAPVWIGIGIFAPIMNKLLCKDWCAGKNDFSDADVWAIIIGTGFGLLLYGVLFLLLIKYRQRAKKENA